MGEHGRLHYLRGKSGEVIPSDYARYVLIAIVQFNGFRQSRVIYTIEADEQTEAEIRGLLS